MNTFRLLMITWILFAGWFIYGMAESTAEQAQAKRATTTMESL